MIEIKNKIENGMSIKRTAFQLNISEKTVKDLVLKNQWKLKIEEFSEDKIDHIVNLYKSGVSAKQLGYKYKIDKRRVQRWAKEAGDLRGVGASRIWEFREDFFDEIDTVDKAYWLGFFYADAYNSDKISTVTLTLASKDKGHLKKLSNILKLPESKINKYSLASGHEACSVKMYSKHMSETLTKRGCPRAKSFIIKYPEWLDKTLDNHFIRGMFDGDGCLTFRKKQREWKWDLASTKECCQKIKEILNNNLKLNVNYVNISKTNNNTYCLETSGNEKINKIMDWLYQGSEINNRLDRKYEKYEALVKQQEGRQIGRKHYFLKDHLKHS